MGLGFELQVAGPGALILNLCSTAIPVRMSQLLVIEGRSFVEAEGASGMSLGIKGQLPRDVRGLKGTLEIFGSFYRGGIRAQIICKCALSDMVDGIL